MLRSKNIVLLRFFLNSLHSSVFSSLSALVHANNFSETCLFTLICIEEDSVLLLHSCCSHYKRDSFVFYVNVADIFVVNTDHFYRGIQNHACRKTLLNHITLARVDAVRPMNTLPRCDMI